MTMKSIENKIKIPTLFWYQNSSNIFLKIEVPNCEEENFEINDNKLKFNKVSEDVSYLIDLELESSIKDYKINVSKFSTHLELNKKEDSWWNKLTKTNEYKFMELLYRSLPKQLISKINIMSKCIYKF